MSEERQCSQCGAALPAHSPQGLCPGCLLKWGLESQTGGNEGESQPTAADYAPPTPEEISAHFPDLEILELVGRGGMGVVYKARQKRLDRLVALKILAPKIGQDPAFAERFAREARAMAMLSHPHVVAVHDFGQTDGLYYFLMEFVDGVNLRRLLDTGKLTPEEALAIVPQICEALQYAHDHGVVHRDIKPENLLLDKEGRVKIADFGIAKLVGKETKDLTLTGAGQIMGTLQYMAPEQIEHPLQVDHRADIYSLGVVFYQMLTGELPIGRFAPPSKRVQIDVRLDEVVLRALEKEPERRYQQVSEIKTQVEGIVTTPRASGEPTAQMSASSRPLKTATCYVSTPEHLRSFRGRFLYIYKGKGELRLDNESLSFRSTWPAIVIPLSSIRKIGQGDFPYSAKPLPLEYIAVTYAEHGIERTVLLAPFAGALLPTTANENVEQWLSALQEAIRACTGQTLPVERGWLVQGTLSMAKMLLMSATTLAVTIMVFWSILTLVKERRLPNVNELLFGPIFAVVMTAMTFLALWDRRRRAIASGNLDLLAPKEARTNLQLDTQTPVVAATVPPTNQWRLGVPLVGVRDGQKVIHWSGVCLYVAAMVAGGPLAVVVAYVSCGLALSILRPGPQMGPSGLLLLYAQFLILALLAAWGVAIAMLIVKIRQALASPIEKLPCLDELERSTMPPPTNNEMEPAAVAELTQWAVGRVKGPAIGLLVTGCSNLVAIPAVCAAQAIAFHQKNMDFAILRDFVPFLVVGVVLAFLQVLGALAMWRLRWYGFAVAASILAIIVSPGNLIGLPVGIWALVMLSRRDVRAAFGRTDRPDNTLTGAAADKPTWQSPDSGWGWLIGKIFGITFISRLAYRCANLSALGFLGSLCCLAYLPLPGMQRCMGFSGFFGFFGLIGVAHIIEAFARPMTTGKRIATATVTAIAVAMSAWLFLACLGALTSQQATAPVAQALGESAVDVAAHPGGPWIAQSQGNITVELLGVGENKKEGNGRWRQPDGSPIKQRPYETLGGQAFGENTIPCEFAVRLGNLPVEPVGTRWQFEPSGSSAGGDRPQAGPEDIRAIAVAIPTTARTVNIRFGLAAGPWKTVAEGHGGNSTALANGIAIAFSNPYAKDDGIIIPVAHTITDQEVRVVAVGKDGREHYSGASSTGSAANMSQITTTFPKVSMKDIGTFCLQARPYHWVEFRNVVLQPRQKADVQVAIVDKLMQLQSRDTEPSPSDLKKVDFVVDSQSFADGDKIVIEEVRSKLSTLATGDTVIVKGTYALASHAKAQLGFYVTQIDDKPSGDPAEKPPLQAITSGSGQFELKHDIVYNGRLHVSFYPVPPGQSFGEVYFSVKNKVPESRAAGTPVADRSGQHPVTSDKATEQRSAGFHLVRGTTLWLGSIGEPFVYDDYDKHFYMAWGAHVVVLPKPAEGFGDFYSCRTLHPGVGRMAVSDVHSASGQPTNVVMPGAIDLPIYQLLLQPSVQHALNLSKEQQDTLQDISAKYWTERRKIAGKELDDMETSSQGELAAYSAKAHHGICQSSTIGSGPMFSHNVVERLEDQWSNTRKEIEDGLTPEQLRTLKDLTFRTFAFGSGVMFEPEVWDKLGASKKQRDELQTLEDELQKEKGRQLRSVTRDKIKKMLAVLTPEQQSYLRKDQSPDKNPEVDCSMYPYPMLPSHMPDTGVADELGFSQEQRESVRKIVTAHWTSLGTLQQEEQGLSLGDDKAFKAIGEKRRQEMADLRKQIEATLTPEQWASCKEMAFQNLAITHLRLAVHNPQAAGGFGIELSKQQIADLRQIETEYFDKPEQIYRELTDTALAAFTPAQQEKLRVEVDRRGW